MSIDLSVHNVRVVEVETMYSNGTTWTVLKIKAQYEGLPEEEASITLYHDKTAGIVAPFPTEPKLREVA